jgi:hypothetical protein
MQLNRHTLLLGLTVEERRFSAASARPGPLSFRRASEANGEESDFPAEKVPLREISAAFFFLCLNVLENRKPPMASKVKTSKTINPLHFEDLEPHRFEDLVRQLIYDFRDWALLEPTGRLGSDDGYDARGLEVAEGPPSPVEEDEESDAIGEAGYEGRLWQIQCKRERSISPAKILRYVDQMIPKGAAVPYGVIFAAPADFSKKTRDAFRDALRQKGAGEIYLWGKADLEDVLYQPKNDHLLFAYFGISLQIQKRSQRGALRGILAIKRKAIKHLGEINRESFTEILIRDIDDSHYPWRSDLPDFRSNPAWKKFYFVGHDHNGIQVLIRRYFAYRDVEYLPPDGKANLKAWDFTKKGNVTPDDPWNNEDERAGTYAVHSFWQNLDQQKRAHFEIVGLVKYENIIDIDPEGDIYAQCPHVYVKRVAPSSFFDTAVAF